MHGKDVRVIQLVFMVRVDNRKSKRIPKQREAWQSCVLSPVLFNTLLKELFKETLQGNIEGISVNGKVVNNLIYYEDKVFIAYRKEGL